MTAQRVEAPLPRIALSKREAAAACGVSTSTITRAKNAGHLKAKTTTKNGGKELYFVADLEAWIASLEDA